jgi:surface protein
MKHRLHIRHFANIPTANILVKDIGVPKHYMFYNATIFNQDIGNWDVGKASDISGMFYRATAFNQDIGSWDVSKVTPTLLNC